MADGGQLRVIDCRSGRVVSRAGLEPAGAWKTERTPAGLLFWTVPRVSATEPPPRAGRLVVMPHGDGGPSGPSFTFERFGARGRVALVPDGVLVVTGEDVRLYRSGTGAEKGAK